MAKNKFGGMGGMGGGMNNMLKQAQKMQQDMEKLQAELAERSVEASAGGGAVTAVVTGKKELTKITISPEACDPDDVSMLEDLILTAVNSAMQKADEMSTSEMGKITGGMSIPGLI